MGNAGLISLDFSLIFTWVNLLLIFLFAKKFLFGRVNAIFDKRKEEIETNLNEANAANEEAKQLQVEYQEQLKGARIKADEIVQTATKVASEKSEEMIESAQTEANQIVSKAQQDIEKQKEVALQEVKGEISDIALALASKVIEKDLSGENHDSLVDDFLENAGDFKWQA